MFRAVCICMIVMSFENAIAASTQAQNTLQVTVDPEATLETHITDESSVRAEVAVRLNAGSTASLWWQNAADASEAHSAQVFQTSRSGKYSILVPELKSTEIRLILRSDDGTVNVSETVLIP
jgi:hypothetical protein